MKEEQRKRRGRLTSRIVKSLFDEQECGGCPKWLMRGTVVVEDRKDGTRYCSGECARTTILATKGEEVSA